jgi:hypothetical protein
MQFVKPSKSIDFIRKIIYIYDEEQLVHGTAQFFFSLETVMKNTFDPQLIYDVFARFGFPIVRIDQFDRGNFAKIRAELKYERLSVDYLLEITTRLKSMEKSESMEIQIINIDMIHKTMRLNITTREDEDTVILT